jgi:C4-dicarboxylate-specific signal transduction histidine kinase
VAVDINEAITEVIALVQHEVLSHRVSLRLELAPTLPAVFADRTQFQQVIVNLVVNAMQAVAQEGNRHRKVSIRTSMPDPATISCTVEDNGSGIKPEHLTRLFDSFFTTKDSGMGMGLSICRSIIESHGGHVTADNETALGGARLCVTLPCSSQYPL